MKKAIVFGANGQDGYFLIELLKKEGIDVIGVSRSGDFNKTDISNYTQVEQLIEATQADYIFHLAANSTTRHDALFENHSTISTVTLNVLEAVKNKSAHSKVFISGSGLQFANHDKPIKETDAFEARDAYSIYRIQSVYAARYFRTLGIKAYVGYFFNHDSPRRSERHMAQKIAAFALRASKGETTEKLSIGDLSVVKEWTYAADVVDGIWLFINQDQVFEANISSGEGHSILAWTDLCFQAVGLDYRDFITESVGFKAEYRQLVSDNSIIRQLGFSPKVSFDQLAKMMVHEG